jgi:hypothetical protein
VVGAPSTERGATTIKEGQMTAAASKTGKATGGVACPPVVVSRRIEAEPAAIFAVLADPGRHTDIDGSEMLRGALTDSVVTGVGDVFVLKMYLERLGGDYQMANEVVEFEQNRRIVWEPRRHDVDQPAGGHRWGFELTADDTPGRPPGTVVTEIFDCSRWPEDDRAQIEEGRIWITAMTTTLELLDERCTA